MLKRFLGFALFWSLLNFAIAQDVLHIGDPVPYSVAIPVSDSVLVLEPSGMPVRILPLTPKKKSDTRSLEFSAAVYDTGSHVIPPLAILIFQQGMVKDTVWTEAREVRVESILPDTASAPRPIKPYEDHPLRVMDVMREFWPWALAALALGALIFAWIRYRNRPKLKAAELVPPPIPPYDLALRELITLRDQKYPERGMLKEQYSEFSEILRRYIEGRFKFPALEMTTYDLAAELKRDDLPSCLRTELLPVLRESDLVKFAKEIPTLAQSQSIIDLGFSVVERTKPQAETETEIAAA